MTTLQLTHTPILSSNAQVLILPVNTAGVLLDSVLLKTKTLYPDNYQRYHRACRDGSLKVGSCLVHKRRREQAGLSVSSNGNQPSYVANLVVSDHPYHSIRASWLKAALIDLQQQLIPLIRYQGVRKAALFARPLLVSHVSHGSINTMSTESDLPSTPPLDWQTVTLALLTTHLQDLPKLHTEVHVPKDINII